MNEENFNIQLRKFLKNVGLSSQREIESSVRDHLRLGEITSDQLLHAKVVLTVPELDLETEIKGEIKLE